MTAKSITKIILIAICLISLDPGSRSFAEEISSGETPEQGIESEVTLPDASSEELHFFAVNAGYKDEASSQNYDFFVLEKPTEEELELGDYEIVYLNSSGNNAGAVSFESNAVLNLPYLVLGFAKSPQYEGAPSEYLYSFGTAGLATTGGALQLYKNDELVDSVCWGKLECEHQLTKFATSLQDNYSFVLRDGEFVQEKYYPGIEDSAIIYRELEKDYCDNLLITEVYSFFETSSSEQFIEIYNPGDECRLDGLSINYKNKNYPMGGKIGGREYFAFRDESLMLTKNPTSANTIAVVSDNGEVIDEMQYPHGQKMGLSYILKDLNNRDSWALSYARTPGAENIYQEFQACSEGKVINEETGNCVNEEQVAETVCPEGKVLNPETGRCKKEETESGLAECAEGYERNPETNRCRKIQDTDGSEYAPKTAVETSFEEPKRFIAYGLLVVAVLAGVVYVIIQYRDELMRALRVVGSKIKRMFANLSFRRKDELAAI